MTQLEQSFISAAQGVEAAIRDQVSAWYPTPPATPAPATGRTDKKDIRDYGAKCNGTTDDSGAIQRALNDVPFPYTGKSTPDINTVVYFPPLRTAIGSKIKVVSPGTIMQGVGLCGGDNHQGALAISTLVTLPGFQGDAAVGVSPQYVNDYWGLTGYAGLPEVRGVAIRNICVDLNATHPLTAFQLRSVSNSPEWVECSAIGGTGMGFDIGGQQIFAIPHSLPCEGLIFRNCYVWGSYNANGNTLGLPMTGPMWRLAGCNEILVIGGKALYDGVWQVGSPYPAISIESEVLNRDNGSIITVGSNIRFQSYSTANPPTHFRVQGASLNGVHYRPSGIVITSCTPEGFNRVLEANQDTPIPGEDWGSWLSMGISMDCSNSPKTPWGTDPQYAVVDYCFGGKFDFDNLCLADGGAGARFGKTTLALQIYKGLNPNTRGEPSNFTCLSDRNVITQS